MRSGTLKETSVCKCFHKIEPQIKYENCARNHNPFTGNINSYLLSFNLHMWRHSYGSLIIFLYFLFTVLNVTQQTVTVEIVITPSFSKMLLLREAIFTDDTLSMGQVTLGKAIFGQLKHSNSGINDHHLSDSCF